MRLIRELERAAWKNRRVYIAFDSDAEHNPDVMDALRRLAAHLIARGAKVLIIHLPDGAPDADGKPTKMGLDDYLVAYGAEALHKLREAATEPEPPDALTIRADARSLDPATTADDLLDKIKLDDVSKLRFYRGGWLRYADGRYCDIHGTEVRAEVVNHVNLDYRGLTQNITGNILDQLRAKALLPGTVEPPAFLGEPPVDADGKPWRTYDIIVARNGMIYLPALVAGRPDYIRPSTPRYFTPAALDCDFCIGAAPPAMWLEFLGQLWPDDSQSISTLQEAMGYTLVLDTRLQKIFMLIGPPRSPY